LIPSVTVYALAKETDSAAFTQLWTPVREELVAISVVADPLGFNEITKFSYWLSQFVGLVTIDEYQLVIHDSIAGGLRCGYEDGSSAFCWMIHTCALRLATVRQP
jgi:hypothetical protein